MNKHCLPWAGLGVSLATFRPCIQLPGEELLPLCWRLLWFSCPRGLLKEQAFSTLVYYRLLSNRLLDTRWLDLGPQLLLYT